MSFRIFFATDIHGSEVCFKKFINAGNYYNVDVIIMGGDLTFKFIVPIISYEKNKYEAFFYNKKIKIIDERKLKHFLEVIGDKGFYPFISDEEEISKYTKDPKKIEKLFQDKINEMLEKWIKFADYKLGKSKIKCLISLGNDDPPTAYDVLKRSKTIIVPDEKVIELDDNHEILSLGYSNQTPWKTLRELTEEQLEKKLESLIKNARNIDNCVFNIHVPPKNTIIDECYGINENLEIIYKNGEPQIINAGSLSVRKAIEKYQPLLGVFGHIHEAKGKLRIGRTLCINPGSAYQDGILQGFVATIENSRIVNYQFVSG